MHTLLISLSETPQVSKLALFVPQMQATRTRRRRRQTRDCVFPCTLMPFHGGHGFCSCSGIVLCSLCAPTPRPRLMLRNSQRQWRCDCHRSHHHKFWFLRRLLLRFCLPAAGNVRDCLNGLAHSTEAALHLHQRGDLAWLLPGLCLAGPWLWLWSTSGPARRSALVGGGCALQLPRCLCSYRLWMHELLSARARSTHPGVKQEKTCSIVALGHEPSAVSWLLEISICAACKSNNDFDSIISL